jgi:hypothetical protein
VLSFSPSLIFSLSFSSLLPYFTSFLQTEPQPSMVTLRIWFS